MNLSFLPFIQCQYNMDITDTNIDIWRVATRVNISKKPNTTMFTIDTSWDIKSQVTNQSYARYAI